MLPNIKVQNLISKHAELEKKLASGEVDKKNFAEMSKEYSELNEIIKEAKYILLLPLLFHLTLNTLLTFLQNFFY